MRRTEARDIDQPEPYPIGLRRQQTDERLNPDMPALALHVGRCHEGHADQQEHGRFVLPVVRAMKQGATKNAIAKDNAGGDQRDRREDDDELLHT